MGDAEGLSEEAMVPVRRVLVLVAVFVTVFGRSSLLAVNEDPRELTVGEVRLTEPVGAPGRGESRLVGLLLRSPSMGAPR